MKWMVKDMTDAALYASWYIFGFLSAIVFLGIWSAFVIKDWDDDEDDSY